MSHLGHRMFYQVAYKTKTYKVNKIITYRKIFIVELSTILFSQILLYISFSTVGQYLRVTKSLASEYSYKYTGIQLCVKDRRSIDPVCADDLTIILSKD